MEEGLAGLLLKLLVFFFMDSKKQRPLNVKTLSSDTKWNTDLRQRESRIASRR